jgi:hypothetical protein
MLIQTIIVGLATLTLVISAIGAWHRYVVRQECRLGKRLVRRAATPFLFWSLAAFNVALYGAVLIALGWLWTITVYRLIARL